jgi:hypothetical protein
VTDSRKARHQAGRWHGYGLGELVAAADAGQTIGLTPASCPTCGLAEPSCDRPDCTGAGDPPAVIDTNSLPPAAANKSEIAELAELYRVGLRQRAWVHPQGWTEDRGVLIIDRTVPIAPEAVHELDGRPATLIPVLEVPIAAAWRRGEWCGALKLAQGSRLVTETELVIIDQPEEPEHGSDA